MNNNGLLSFGESISTFTPQPLPLEERLRFIAPFWADVDTRKAGRVWYREANDSATLDKIKVDVASEADFSPQSALIVTWDSVGYYSANFDLVCCVSTCIVQL